MLTLFVHVKGIGSTFSVKIGKSETDIDADQLVLYKVDLDDDENIAQAAEQATNGEKPLKTSRSLAKVFETVPLEERISIVVELPNLLFQTPIPSETVLGKRFLSQVEDDLKRYQKHRLNSDRASHISTQIEYRSLQGKPRDRILDDRPDSDNLPPLPLLFNGFGFFHDIFKDRHYTRTSNKMRGDLEEAVDSFSEAMTQLYDKEQDRMIKGLETLNKIFTLRNGGCRPFMAAAIGNCQTDGHFDGPHNIVSCVVEFKNELAATNSIPAVELLSYVCKSHAQQMANRKYLSPWRIPCLGLTIAGPYVMFFGIIFLKPLWRIVSLTPMLSCILSAVNGDDRQQLYAAFYAALDLSRRIDDEALLFINGATAMSLAPHPSTRLPYISALTKWGDSGEIRFRIVELYPETQDYRHLYIARLDNDKEIIVKFSQRYSIELHQFCASRGHAPKILGFERLPGGFFAIAMEYIFPSETLNSAPNRAHFCDKWSQDLWILMESFHEAGFVHGDLREPNILCDGENVMLLDFDWGGKAGDAQYPTGRLIKELTFGRAEDANSIITTNDDRRVLRNTLDRFKIAATRM
ncbi:hypothetical protein F5148DRAFT_1375789 [Russula earlei]|uniref:Uncharacterized protein n=1 Tax=Russula earlei TaxID=71964 RepID=A0ACC0UBN3_9AGAM|nr:hypothetical protein F5148DRAFT_1375789 [Russula earlei]